MKRIVVISVVIAAAFAGCPTPTAPPASGDAAPVYDHEVEYVATQSPVEGGYVVYNDAEGNSVDVGFAEATWTLTFGANAGASLSLRVAALPDSSSTVTVTIYVDTVEVATDSDTGGGFGGGGADVTVTYDL